MSDIAIKVEGLGKRYELGEMRSYETIRESLVRAGRGLGRKLAGGLFPGSSPKVEDKSFWALKDVSFEVKQGEVVGIIGRNGAGKSTLLKILSRITDPTEGHAELHGRVGSLLEVGTGFHPELTGRENIYLNGAILGMTRAEIKSRFDEIVAFSEIEKFLDTPVKRYSSGMYVRLAFAVAAHLEPEILIVDEVLAVGDAEFQKKCLGKMSDVAHQGRTVLFVSHNMAAVEGLCEMAILFQDGRIRSHTWTPSVIERYQEGGKTSAYDVDLRSHVNRAIGRMPIFRRFRILSRMGDTLRAVGLGEEVVFEIHLSSEEKLCGIAVGIHICNLTGMRVVSFHSGYQMPGIITVDGPTVVRCQIPAMMLMPGQYSIALALASGHEQIDRIEPCGSFDVVERNLFCTGKVPPAKDGVFVCPAAWSLGSMISLEAFSMEDRSQP